jgi:hypothetical protein
MDGIYWFLVVGITGWFAGKMIGEAGYGKSSYADGLDILLGILGATIGGYLYFGVFMGEGSAASVYVTTILSSIAFVGVARLICVTYLPANSR